MPAHQDKKRRMKKTEGPGCGQTELRGRRGKLSPQENIILVSIDCFVLILSHVVRVSLKSWDLNSETCGLQNYLERAQGRALSPGLFYLGQE